MRYQTPQFIEEDEKLFGQLTFKQFVYLVGGVGIAFVLYRLLPHFIAIIVMIPVLMLGLALAFYRVNDRPFIVTLEAAFYFIFSHRLYTYKKIDKPVKQMVQEDKKTKIAPASHTKMTSSKLKDLAWSLDINEKQSKQVDNFE